MNIIIKHPRNQLGYNFIPAKYLPKGKDEYYLRNIQNPNSDYRQLNGSEIEILIRNANTSDDWGKILVSKAFDPSLVKNNKFFGLVRIGKLEPYYLEFHNLRMPVGIYNSTIISTDIGDNVCIENVPYLSHYIIGNEVMLANINELATTNYAKFGNGILKDGETDNVRIWLELRNESGGRKALPFNNIEAGDAYLWSEYPEDHLLREKMLKMTAKETDSRRGYYGTIGDRCIIKDCRIIKDVKIGSDAYIKGANKLKNLTVNSDEISPSQIGEGCELVNGIIGYGCRIFYGVKAVRFVLAEHSQLKYGARLINSYLGSNSTISCCEVLNSVIYPAHEQHHNNSFLVAGMTMGQSNIAAGTTIGSNHNSRAADGEIIAGRGFWPGLCVSMKHNSKFASYCMVVNGAYPFELNITLPFTLVSNLPDQNKLILRPGYWFKYNMYALARNSAKFRDRDKRKHPVQLIEYDFLAPDTVNEMFDAIKILQNLQTDENGNAIITGVENSKRLCEVKNVGEAIGTFKDLILYYGVSNILNFIKSEDIDSLKKIKKYFPNNNLQREKWINVGGQLIREADVENLKKEIKKERFKTWDQVHNFYRTTGEKYRLEKVGHAIASLLEITEIPLQQVDEPLFKSWLKQSLQIRQWMSNEIYNSREKDYRNPFRKMTYHNDDQMNTVMGNIRDNPFIKKEQAEMREFKRSVSALIKSFGL